MTLACTLYSKPGLQHLVVRLFLAYLLLSVLPSSLRAQEDTYHQNLRAELQSQYGITGGSWAFSPNVATTTSAMGGGTVIPVSGQPFSSARSLTVTTVPANPWNASMSLPTSASIASGDRLLLVFWARTESANGVSTATDSTRFGLAVFAFEKKSGNFRKDLNFEQRVVGGRWKRYVLPFTAGEAYPVAGAGLGFQLGFQQQTVQVGGVALLNFGQNPPVQLPTVSHSEYAGMEDSAPWRAEANERIDRYRKANLAVKVTSQRGQVLPDAQVTVEMIRHQYAFGTAINETLLSSFRTSAPNASTNATYESKLFNLDGKGHGFSELVFENGHKWVNWEFLSADSRQRRHNVVKALNSQGVRVRGHVLVWPGWGNSPADLRTKGTATPPDLAGLTTRMNDRVTSMLTQPDIKDIILDWDVINEPTGNVDIANTFRGSPGYSTGREVYVDIFKKAEQVNPAVKRYINEANVTNAYVKNDFYRQIVGEIVQGGGKVDGVGFQAHMRYLVPPTEMYQHFTDFHQLTNGGAVKITEYDNKTLGSPELEAKYLRDLLTITFSHPASEGFLMWGFWDGAHYAGRAPLFDRNWNLKPEGKPFIDLVFNEWWTPTTTLGTNSAGEAGLRGFKGDYKITVTRGGQQIVDTVRLDRDSTYLFALTVPTTIIRQPESASVVCVGAAVSVSVAAEGPVDSYQWYKDGVALTGVSSATTAALSLSAVGVEQQGNYTVVVNGVSSLTSTPFQLSVSAPADAPDAKSLTVTQGTPNVALSVSNCPGVVSWNGTDGEPSLPVSTTATGTFSFSVVCKTGLCVSPVTVATVAVLVPAPADRLSVHYRDGDNNQTSNNIIRPYLKLYNTGTTAVPYGEIAVRYWLTAENFAPMTNLSVYWAQIGTNKVRMKYVALPQPRQGALGYIEYSFDASAGELAAGGNSGEIQTGVAKQNWTNFNETDDYSFVAQSAYTQTERITVYRNNTLIWGTEPQPLTSVTALKVYSENKNGNPATNQISTHLKVANEGNVPVDYSGLTIRYWFTVEGDKPLVYTVDYAELGNANVKSQFGKQNRAGADTYLELSFAPALGQLQPGSTTGLIQQRINKGDWSPFNEADDHSYKAAGPLAENARITAYLNGTLVYGQEPTVSGARVGSSDGESALRVTVLGNPIVGDQIDVAVSGVEGQPLRLLVTDVQGQVVAEYQTERAASVERHQLSVSCKPAGMLLLQVSTNREKQTIKLLKP
ncbi:hypothetical protein DYU11_02935 [Fibrisoma montanum]|uniref:Beta-xylanase n=1 Tax=Fibrisoma montanum TaxID=2305895 RepID=A0A418MIU7_9BACT|nr:cellulose binding domain-containing protein [Fibrisoma montanum]RIV27283.1 hypothetical protein DYU11_02935 [Fibrisoma montanum]